MARTGAAAKPKAKLEDGWLAFQGVERWPIDKIRPNPKNSKRHPPEQLLAIGKSFDRFGWTLPILVDEQSMLIAGEGRWLEAKNRKYAVAPVIVARGWSDAKKREYMEADNRLAQIGMIDEAARRRELQYFLESGADMTALGWGDDDALRAALAAPEAPDRKRDDEVPALPAVVVSRPGDLWLMGDHRLLCGDSFDPEHVDRLFGKVEHADAFLQDPPYAIYGSATGIASDIADDKMVRPFFEKLGAIVQARVKEFGHVYICCDWRSYAVVWHGMKTAKMSPKNCIVWDKGGAGLGSNYANTHEFVAYFAKLPPQKAMTSGNKRGQRTVHASNIFRTNRVTGEERQHNAAKPVDLLEWIIGHATDEGEVVVDLFAGSGSTIVAGHRGKRRVFAMEMEPGYVDVCVRRWEKVSGQTAKLESGETLEELTKTRKPRRTGR